MMGVVDDSAPNFKILLVDDSRTVLNVLRTYLMGAGFEFLEAADGKAALRLVLREQPAVVITDLEMPQMDGLELCRAIRSAPGLARTKLILISAKWTAERQKEAEKLSVNASLLKPIDCRELARLVARWFV